MLHALKIVGEVILGLAVTAGVVGVIIVVGVTVLILVDQANGKNPFQ